MKCEMSIGAIPDTAALSKQADGFCPVDWALSCVSDAASAACGRTTMCRDGLMQLKTLLHDITGGKGRTDDLSLLEDLCGVIAADADCGLAAKAAGNVLYSLRTFREEWEKHCNRKRCTALVCKAYYDVYIDPALCSGCGECLQHATVGTVAGGEGLIHVVKDGEPLKQADFLGCCPRGAVKKAGAVKPQLPAEPVPVGSFAATGGLRRHRGN